MKADSVNRWLTLSANIGVVIGLILLLIELDQNSDLVRVQIHQARSDTWVSDRTEFADTEYLLPAYRKFISAGGPVDPSAMDELDPVESARVYRYLEARLGDYDNLFYQYEQGYLDEEFYRARIEPSIKRLAPTWMNMDFLNRIRPSFVAEIERLNSSSR